MQRKRHYLLALFTQYILYFDRNDYHRTEYQSGRIFFQRAYKATTGFEPKKIQSCHCVKINYMEEEAGTERISKPIIELSGKFNRRVSTIKGLSASTLIFYE